MTPKQLKDWLATIPAEALIEVNHTYSWKPLKPNDIRATFISSPKMTMENVCNAEEVSV